MKRWYTLLTLATMIAIAGAYAGTCGAGKSCGAHKNPEPKEAEAGIINPAGVAALIKAEADVVILDARSGKYDDGRRIPGAKSLNDKSTPKEIAKIVPEKDALVVTYCSNTKCPASNRLAKHLTKLGYSNILEMPQGIDGWVAEGRDVEKVN